MCNCNITENVLVEGTPEFNLYDEFHDANKKYFGGRLRLDFPLVYKKRAGSFGWVRAKLDKRGRQIVNADILGLFINGEFKYTREQFLSTFLHELCHVAMLQNAIKYSWSGGYHGYEWKELAANVSKASGIKITENEASHTHDREDAKKEYIVVLKVPSDENRDGAIATMSTVTWDKAKEQLMNVLPQYESMGYDIFVYKTKSSVPKSFARDSRKNVQFYVVPKDKFDVISKFIERDDTTVLYPA